MHNLTRRSLLVAGAAGCLAPLGVRAESAGPRYSYSVSYQAMVGTMTVNGIPILRFDGDGSSEGNLGLWLRNGSNQVRTQVETAGHGASLQLRVRRGPGSVSSVAKSGRGQTAIGITAKGLPDWSFERGEPYRPSDLDDMVAAVEALYAAYEAQDLATIDAFEAPMLEDMARGSPDGPSVQELRRERNRIIKEGTLRALGHFRLERYLDDRLVELYDRDDRGAPIRLVAWIGGKLETVQSGRFWSRLNGEWRVVR